MLIFYSDIWARPLRREIPNRGGGRQNRKRDYVRSGCRSSFQLSLSFQDTDTPLFLKTDNR